MTIAYIQYTLTWSLFKQSHAWGQRLIHIWFIYRLLWYCFLRLTDISLQNLNLYVMNPAKQISDETTVTVQDWGRPTCNLPTGFLRSLKFAIGPWRPWKVLKFPRTLKSPGISSRTQQTSMILTQKQQPTIVILIFEFYYVLACWLK